MCIIDEIDAFFEDELCYAFVYFWHWMTTDFNAKILLLTATSTSDDIFNNVFMTMEAQAIEAYR